MLDLFGQEAEVNLKRKTDKAHSSRPGSGPQGETCGSCSACTRISYHGKTYFKCNLMHAVWTHGPGTDIRKKDPACKDWTGGTP